MAMSMRPRTLAALAYGARGWVCRGAGGEKEVVGPDPALAGPLFLFALVGVVRSDATATPAVTEGVSLSWPSLTGSVPLEEVASAEQSQLRSTVNRFSTR
jgi:hypothetical protein